MFKIEIGSMFAVCLSINNTMMLEFPTIIESIICSNKNCEKYPSVIERPISYITFEITNGQIQELQQFINKRLSVEKLACLHNSASSNCTGFQNIESKILPVLIFIEILFWKGILIHFNKIKDKKKRIN
jgi:hypothetical protein